MDGSIQTPELSAVGAGNYAVGVHVESRRRLNFLR
jgi:hypothetical protein